MKTNYITVCLTIVNILTSLFCCFCLMKMADTLSDINIRNQERNFHWMEGRFQENKEAIDHMLEWVKIGHSWDIAIKEEISATQEMVNREKYIEHLTKQIGTKEKS